MEKSKTNKLIKETKEDLKKRIEEEEDFIHCRKFNNSLTRFMDKNAQEPANAAIARLLMITEEEVEAIYEESIAKLRESMIPSKDED